MWSAYKSFWKNYANFNGRTSRRGYWFVILMNCILLVLAVGIGLLIIVGTVGSVQSINDVGNILSGGALLIIWLIICFVYLLAAFIPSLAISVRRLHDQGKKWYWVIILIVSAISPSIAGKFLDFSWEAILSNKTRTPGFWIFEILGFVAAIAWIVIAALPSNENGFGEPTDEYSYINGNDNNFYDNQGGYNQVSANNYREMPQQNNNFNYGNDPSYAETSLLQQNMASGVAPGSIKGITGMYTGATFPMADNEAIVIGRDSAVAHIVISEHSEKISREHVRIVFDPRSNQYTVIDRSSNGTYLDNGTRLLSNQVTKLPRGSVIYLARRDNTFRLM
ncbi:MAG: DUF805 domain-containing protein [Lachnospiraceae bacterium]|jgi:uncharacterized membrane protein YhaH (DUF805 family)|nr:DUF805 domain-containing protein [Lachnospiraceae bacterium]